MSAMASALAFFATAFSPEFQSFAYRQGGAACSASRRLRHMRVNPYQFQFAGADAPRQRPVSLSLLPGGTGHHLPGCAFVAAPGLLIHAVKLTLGLAFHLPTHVLSQSVRGRRVIHLSKRLSCSPSSDGFKTIGKAFDEWTKTNFRIGQK